jgi:glycosyltransferase involved in cell wall biosynthesis
MEDLLLNNKITMQPLVSIITVVYNGEKYLEQTINSVVNQTYKNIEYIIIDGGSTDGTHQIVEEYNDHISYFVSEPDNGLYDAMNKGISAANGELIGMINSDDWYELNAVEIMVNAYIANPDKTIFHADRYDVDDDGNKKIKKFNPSNFKFKYYGMTYNHPSMFITKSEYVIHRYNTNLRSLSDYQFVLETFMRDRGVFCYLNKALVNYRLDGISAQMPLLMALKEGVKARKNTGFNFFHNLISFCLRFSVSMINRIKRL